MSLQGRRWVDKFRFSVKQYIRMPSPPYGSPKYWTSMYKNFKPEDIFEWGNLTFERDLCRYDYRTIKYNSERDVIDKETKTTSWAETLQLDPGNNHRNEGSSSSSSIMILGCGYSNLGKDMVDYGWRNITEVDNCSKVISDLSTSSRARSLEYVEDDAKELSAFDTNSMDAIIDKGLMDSLCLDYQEEQMTSIMTSVQRVLKPRGVFLFFSLSQPDYILPMITHKSSKIFSNASEGWESMEVREFNDLLLYRYLKKSKKKEQPLKKLKRNVNRNQKSRRR